MKKETKKEIEKVIWVLVLIFGLGFVFFGHDIFFRGFHNVDLSRNILKISYFENLNYTGYFDITLQGDRISYDTAYSVGLQQFISGFYIALLGMFFFSSALTYFLLKEKER